MTIESPETRSWPLRELGLAVEKTVRNLQRGILADHREAVIVATLAKLRRAAVAKPGTIPEVWPQTIDIVPDELSGHADQGATPAEYAAHVAVTLYALHQQGKTVPMNRSGGSLGSAAQALARATGRDDAIRRRFQAIALADTDAGIVHHLRAMVTLLRSEGTALDYGRLADDLRDLFGREYAGSVRLRWGRDYRAARGIDSTIDLDNTTTDDEK